MTERRDRPAVPRLTDAYARRNCTLLVNETAVHCAAGTELLITGLDDLVLGVPDLARALRGVEPRAHHLLLAHCPAQRDTLISTAGTRESALLDPFAPEVVLSGDTHGGQVNLLGFAPWVPWGSGRYLSGWYREANPPLYVSRGLGTLFLPVRPGATLEIAHFELFLPSA